jgi:hypothetical protein
MVKRHLAVLARLSNCLSVIDLRATVTPRSRSLSSTDDIEGSIGASRPTFASQVLTQMSVASVVLMAAESGSV